MKRITTTQLRRKPRDGERIVMVTCYDATFARLVDEANVDVILIGDSLGMVVQGHENTLPVTLDEMIYHCRAVARGAQRAHLASTMATRKGKATTRLDATKAFL
jgi:3-methyl-2-oxobutanoate hydroxymethyltransferase